jgi:DNA (cytosine-5)-methyltransferase 1
MSSALELLNSRMLDESHNFESDQSVSRLVGFDSGKSWQSQMRIRVPGVSDPWDAWWLSFLRGGVAQSRAGRPRDVRVIDLFSSAGGLSLGVREAARALNFRFQSLLAADLDLDALHTYKMNFAPAVLANRSVRELVDYQVIGRGMEAELAHAPQAIDEASDFQGVDLIIGGPPCQGHSSLNNHTRGDDARNDLYLTVPALAVALGAKAVIVENVPRVVRDKQQVVSTSIRLLEEAGYFVTSGVLTASSIGWPQTRSRHFLVASRDHQPAEISDVAEIMQRPARPIWWAIEDLEGLSGPDHLFDSVPRMSDENRKRIDHLFDNDLYDLPNHVRPDCHKDGHTYPSVYGRLSKHAPAPTITTGFQTPGRGRYVHPTERRVLTAHEAARIQGFPDSFQFRTSSGDATRGQLQKWIGDAVPSVLGYIVGLVALSTFDQERAL